MTETKMTETSLKSAQLSQALWQGSCLLMLAGVIGGWFNYAVQLQGAKILRLEEYGQLNSWIANTMLLLSICGVFQPLGNFFPLEGIHLLRASLVMLVIAVITACGLVAAAMWGYMHPWGWTLAALPLAIICAWITGQLQQRLAFAGIAVAGFVGSATKFTIVCIPIVPLDPLVGFYLAFTLSLAVAAISLAHFGIRKQIGQAEPLMSRENPMARGICACILTMAGAVLPQLDVINLRHAGSSEMIGEYSRASLFAKAIWFGAAALLQVTLPLMVRNRSGAAAQLTQKRIWFSEVVVMFGCTIAAFVSTWLAPPLAARYLGFDLSTVRPWILLTSLTTTVLFTLLCSIQRSCVQLNWRLSAIQLAFTLLPIPICMILKPADVGNYLILTFGYYVCLLILNWLMPLRRSS